LDDEGDVGDAGWLPHSISGWQASHGTDMPDEGDEGDMAVASDEGEDPIVFPKHWFSEEGEDMAVASDEGEDPIAEGVVEGDEGDEGDGDEDMEETILGASGDVFQGAARQAPPQVEYRRSEGHAVDDLDTVRLFDAHFAKGPRMATPRAYSEDDYTIGHAVDEGEGDDDEEDDPDADEDDDEDDDGVEGDEDDDEDEDDDGDDDDQAVAGMLRSAGLNGDTGLTGHGSHDEDDDDNDH